MEWCASVAADVALCPPDCDNRDVFRNGACSRIAFFLGAVCTTSAHRVRNGHFGVSKEDVYKKARGDSSLPLWCGLLWVTSTANAADKRSA